MIKEIKYDGYTAQPSDYDSPDGDLALSLNLISEDGAIRPIASPWPALRLLSDGFEMVHFHATSTYRHLILWKQSSLELYWLDFPSGGKTTKEVSADDLTLVCSLPGKPISVSAMGNILMASVDGYGVIYVLWEYGEYKYLGNRPPFIPVEFGLTLHYEVGTSWDDDVDTPLERTQTGASAYSDEALKNITDCVYGKLLKDIEEKVTNKGLFYQPFFVRYAVRLFDGTCTWHSSPVLMLPTVTPPVCSVNAIPGRGEIGSTTKLWGGSLLKAFRLRCRILNFDIEEFERWKSIIKSIDIFVSAPIYTWDQGGTIGKTGSAKEVWWTDFDKLSGALYRSCPQSDVISENGENNSDSEESKSGNVRPGSHHDFDEIGDGQSINDVVTPDTFFVGRYSEAEPNTYGYVDHENVADTDKKVMDIPPNKNFHDQIVNTSSFYHIATIPFESVKPDDNFKSLRLINRDLSNLVTRETLPDDYESHSAITPKFIHIYNNRSHFANISIKPAVPFPIRTLGTAAGGDRFKETYQKVTITAYTHRNSSSIIAETPEDVEALETFEAYCIDDIEKNFPRYIYYPDSRAFKMRIQTSAGHDFYIPLSAHAHLNGAYWYGGFDVSPLPASSTAVDESEFSDFFLSPEKIHVSAVNNPLVYPATSIVSLSSEVLSVASAAKALSQGQFGQFPLYAFTADGVWAMEVSSTGTYSARQPITRDVCINVNGITQLDNAVLFPTDRGIMIISGSQSQSISEVINSGSPFNPLLLPEVDKLHGLLKHPLPTGTKDNCLPLPPFSDFLRKCSIIYDYVNQRVIVYSPDVTNALVYSLKTSSWGMIYSDIIGNINSYPEALAINRNNELVDLSRAPDAKTISGLLITRPLKLDAPDILKTVDTIIQRGYFHKGHVQSVLYGSRDLIKWHLVWSSKDHFLRGFRGTPYKYFRIALICNLEANESITGASIQFTPRKTNQLR